MLDKKGFQALMAQAEEVYNFKLPEIMVRAYYNAFSRQGWTVEDLNDATEETIEHETGYGRMPPAAKFVEHFKARRQREEDEAMMATPDYQLLVECEADRLEARRRWARVADPNIRAQSFRWAYSTEKLAERLKELGYEQ